MRQPGPQPWAWGAYDVKVKNRETGHWEPLDVNKTYRIATNEFLAPAGQDGFVAFKYMKNISYWGDMLDGVERWVAKTYTADNPYDGKLDGRITPQRHATRRPDRPGDHPAPQRLARQPVQGPVSSATPSWPP